MRERQLICGSAKGATERRHRQMSDVEREWHERQNHGLEEHAAFRLKIRFYESKWLTHYSIEMYHLYKVFWCRHLITYLSRIGNLLFFLYPYANTVIAVAKLQIQKVISGK